MGSAYCLRLLTISTRCRLRWAAGANPEVAELQSKFETAIRLQGTDLAVSFSCSLCVPYFTIICKECHPSIFFLINDKSASAQKLLL